MPRRENRYVLGKTDYERPGVRNCEAAITWTLEDGEFSMCAEVWQSDKRDVITCGQCVDHVASLFPQDTKAARMVEVWRRWHLNKMRAGSPSQESYLREHPIPPEDYAYPKSYYEVVSKVLADAGLNPDENDYRYGHAWNAEPLPPEVVAEIESWSK